MAASPLLAPLDPRIMELVRALARAAAREDHQRAIERQQGGEKE